MRTFITDTNIYWIKKMYVNGYFYKSEIVAIFSIATQNYSWFKPVLAQE